MNFVGRWTKVTSTDCDRKYPAQIEFFETRYLGQKGPDQDFVIWDVGGYAISSDNEAMIQIATDEQVQYRFRFDGETLTFADPDGCDFSYQRVT